MRYRHHHRLVYLMILLLGVCSVQLAGEEKPAQTVIQTLPESRGGQDVLGSRLALPLKFDRWLPPAAKDNDKGKGKDNDAGKPAKAPRATLYRWWTNGCPFCEETLPAIEALRKTYGDDGLRVVAVYHPKPPREVSDEQIRKYADGLGYHGDIAVDTNWSVLKEAYLSKNDRRATSISLLVDADGVIRFVHPGTEYFPSKKAEESQQNADYELLTKAIRALLPKAQ
jgi:thiol-disulfide isomerase/thioredoxin